jgi:hypothetical protein
MHFSKIGDLYKASLTTGPRHNCLFIAFSNHELSKPSIVKLPRIGECNHAPLNEALILENVIKGVIEANNKFKTKYRVNRVEYVENDTPPETTYAYLTYKIIENLFLNEKFEESA